MKYTVVWYTEDKTRHERSFEDSDMAHMFQEYLVFGLGLDAEVQ